MSAIYLYNTLAGQKEVLTTELPGRVTMYVCGPTVYNYAHIGNARPAVVFDVLARLLRHDYRCVLYARNFTDVDDKINAAAVAEGVGIDTITDRYIEAYHEDLEALGVKPPDLEPRVTEHIADIIELIQALIIRGHAYEASGHVLFHVPSYSAYGALSKRKPEDMLAGARVEVAPYKRSPLDFVLWKPSSENQPGWTSPWGYGRPGWHVECSAMIGKHLGTTIDIHGGGQDLIFPHHENEIAQGTCANGTRYCRTWVHNSFVTVDGQKMSKSKGKVLLIRDLFAQAPGEAIRLALLSTHYRHPLDWNERRQVQSIGTLTRWYTSLARVEGDKFTDCSDTEPDGKVLEALRDDLNVPLALARLHELCRQLDRASTADLAHELAEKFRVSAGLLGLLQKPAQLALSELRGETDRAEVEEISLECIEALVHQRQEARHQRDFSRADALREQLELAGVVIEDTEQGPRWHKAIS
ncbi:cysteine--tRNA ligase [Marinobacter sp. 1_MG-2023]|uniref:cysteine--tRNA ligase n=1 Tax=Marinobacter sp. 1_MG-2023 TaxID=3062627 RepID=UPI0026E4729A|nr:cysteine--tRNA ligase [Marinobacter sp. 1_MG-2023]MDO6824883.1 cysteine--tRNA ligase [Marinobacter sp. 1_MG-2023]